MIKLKSVTKKYGDKAIFEDVSFTIEQGEIIGLVGENGAGKSTLLNVLATLQQPTAGSIYLKNISYHKNVNDIRKKIGFVPQDIAIWDEFTVEENMTFFEKLSWKKKTNEQLKLLCENMELDRWKEHVSTLSGGMKRKLNLAISLIHDPELLLLDEPTVGIDLKSKIEIATYLKHLAKKELKTIIYISHDMDEIVNLCDRIFCLGDDPFYEEHLKKKNESVNML